MKKKPIACPQCSSMDVRREKVSGLAFLISVLLLGFPLPFLKRKYHCFECGMDFKL
jgi:DNA-directed RNA polymerase subunit RPC12/RpoP